MPGTPLVAIMPDPFIRGAANTTDAVDPLLIIPFEQAMNKDFGTDVHFVAYQVTGAPAWPRLKKPILSRIRMMHQDVVSTMLVLDYDNPQWHDTITNQGYKHAPWSSSNPNSPFHFSDFLDRLFAIGQQWPLAMRWHTLYATRGGARIIYIFDHPVPVDAFEPKHLGMCQGFANHGMPEIDCTVSDWTRLFRLPRVKRDGRPTWTEGYYEVIEQEGNTVNFNELPSSGVMAVVNYGDVQQFDTPKPDLDVVKTLIEDLDSGTGRFKKTDFYKEAKVRLKGRDCWDCLFDNKPLAEVGKRGSTLLKYVGQAIAMLIYVEGTTPDHIFGLFLDAVLQLEPAPDVQDWTDELWRHIGTYWAREDAKRKLEEVKAEVVAQQSVNVYESIIAGMREWNRSPELHSSDINVVKTYVDRHLIASVGKVLYIMGKDGMYDGTMLSPNQLIGHVRAMGLTEIIETRAIGNDGGYTDRPIANVLNQYATVVGEIAGVPCIRGGYIDKIDTQHAVLKVPSFSRNEELVPTFSPEVDMWLQRFFGANYDVGIKWISWALAFEEGAICALSINGAAGAGKKLLVEGLAECLTNPTLATAEDLVGQWQYGLMRSPYLIVNEGWPAMGKGRHPADSFRALVSGDPLMANMKFQAPVKVNNPVRIIFTANNLEVIKMLCSKRELSPEDRQALAIRLLHFNVGDEASEWLKTEGGMKFTSKPGRRWIRTDIGGESDFVLAKHFLWLYNTRHQRGPTGGRFLVEGNDNTHLLFEMRTQSGMTPLVIEAVLQMIEKNTEFPGLTVEDGRIYVLSYEVLSYFRNNMNAKTRESLTTAGINNVFRSLCVRDASVAIALKSRKEMGRRHWKELDTRLLLEVARREGMRCKRLETIDGMAGGPTNHDIFGGILSDIGASA